jgi:aspartate/methionine/tyrosine aminotransferase
MLNLSSGEARWNPFEALGIRQDCPSASELASGQDELGLSGLRDAYCRAVLGGTLRSLRQHDFDVLITNGAKEALWTIGATLAEPQRGVLMPRVGWPGYGRVAKGLGLRSWYYDVAHRSSYVAELARARPALLVVNSPHNPSGHELGAGARAELQRIASSVGCELVFDDTLRSFGRRAVERARLWPQKAGLASALRVDSVSKWLGMPGLRVGFVVGPRARLLELARYRDQISSGVSSLAQAWVAKVLAHPGLPAVLGARLKKLRSAACQTAAWLRSVNCQLDGEFPLYAWARPADPTALVDGVLSLADLKLEVADGALFGAPGWFRLCPHNSPSLRALLHGCSEA